MTKDDIIRMAREAGWDNYDSQDERLQRFFHLAAAAGAAAEREACAKLCDEVLSTMFPARVSDCAAIIRARGNT